MRVYISGGITGVPDYKERFSEAEKELKEKGHEVISPAKVSDVLPSMDYEEYMSVDLLLLSMCDAIYMLEGWEKSTGANREYCYAVEKCKMVIEEQEGKKV